MFNATMYDDKLISPEDNSLLKNIIEYINKGQVRYRRFSDVYSNATLFPSNIHFTAPTQGYLNDCYILSSLGIVAEHENVTKSLFVNTDINSAGIYGVKFYIRGKPWIVTVDEDFWFWYDDTPLFARPVEGKNGEISAMWISIVEKAWAKVKGSYFAAEGGFMENGLRALSGVPVVKYETNEITNKS